jgi:hypothetical protein
MLETDEEMLIVHRIEMKYIYIYRIERKQDEAIHNRKLAHVELRRKLREFLCRE